VNVVAVPIATLVAPTKEMLPAHDAAVVVVPVEFAAVLITLTDAVSVLPIPVGGKVNERVDDDVVVCPNAAMLHAPAAIKVAASILRIMIRLSGSSVFGDESPASSWFL